ncbi:MAG: sensor domain-containing protein [Mycobacterium sp.]|nr:sensor domain-containing protein [Mycobacterium sp.]
MLFVAGLAAGCTAIAGGAARPAPGLVPRPLTGRMVAQALLDGAELGRAFGQEFKPDPDRPASAGGRELLRGNAETPRACGGLIDPLITDSYEGADVRDVASSSWEQSSPNPAAVVVDEAVVALPTEQAADATFTAAGQRWSGCSGAWTMVGGDADFTSHVGAMQENNSVVSAPVDQISSYMTLPEARAFGVRDNCIVEVNIVYFSFGDRDGTARHVPSAADVAQLLMEKVSKLA